MTFWYPGFGLKGQRSTLRLRLTAIRRGFELYVCMYITRRQQDTASASICWTTCDRVDPLTLPLRPLSGRPSEFLKASNRKEEDPAIIGYRPTCNWGGFEATIGLSSAWKKATNRETWWSVVDTATLKKSIRHEEGEEHRNSEVYEPESIHGVIIGKT